MKKNGWLKNELHITLNRRYKYDIINHYFSERIIEDLKKHDIKALDILDWYLECYE